MDKKKQQKREIRTDAVWLPGEGWVKIGPHEIPHTEGGLSYEEWSKLADEIAKTDLVPLPGGSGA